jgi:hypothetical protein
LEAEAKSGQFLNPALGEGQMESLGFELRFGRVGTLESKKIGRDRGLDLTDPPPYTPTFPAWLRAAVHCIFVGWPEKPTTPEELEKLGGKIRALRIEEIQLTSEE